MLNCKEKQLLTVGTLVKANKALRPTLGL